MNAIDFFIIYLSCGAPCGVYFYLQNRKRLESKTLWVKAFLTVFVWIPYAFVWLNDFATKQDSAKRTARKRQTDVRLFEIQKQLWRLQIHAESKIPLFEMKEVLERYIGLTEACSDNSEIPGASEKEIFRIALRKNTELGANCLHRRNRQRLKFHQTLAREDFLQTISKIRHTVSEPKKLENLALEFAQVLGDPKSEEMLKRLFAETLQSRSDFYVKNRGMNQWKPNQDKRQSSTEQISFPFRYLTQTNLATTRKD